MAYDGAGTLFALGLRLTKLGANGSPLVGDGNTYTTDALISLELGLEYNDPDAISQANGSGVICLSYQPPSTLTGGTISSLQVCTPDPNVLQWLIGGTIYVDTTGTKEIGYQAPEVGTNPTPNGVSIEFWTRAILDGAYANDLPYLWWVVPRAFVTPSDTWKISGEDPTLPSFDGNCTQNGNWKDGPVNDFPMDSSRVWQFLRVGNLPDLTPGSHAVLPEATVTGIQAASANNETTVLTGGDLQMQATITYSDARTRDVTGGAAWATDDSAIATVDVNGVVHGVSAGTANITATYDDLTSAPVIITVTDS